MNQRHRRSRQLAAQRSGRVHRRSRDLWKGYLSARASMVRGLNTLLPITEDTAANIAAVFASVRTISEVKASLPVHIYERKGTGVRDAVVTMHPVAEVLARAPNPYQTPFVFHQQRQANLCLWGDAFCVLTFDGRGDLIDAEVRHPFLVEPFLDGTTHDGSGRPRLRYRIDGQDGSGIYDASAVLHTPGLTFDGLRGESVVSHAAQSMQASASSERMAALFFANGAKPSMIVTTPEYLDDEPFARLQRELNEDYSADNSFRALLLEGGATANFSTMPFKDVQLLESRRFQGEEIACRWFGLPAHLAGYLESASYNTLTEQDRAFVTHRLTPWLVRDEQEWNRKAFRDSERGKYYVKYNVDGLLRGDTKSRYEAHRNALFAGWKTVNEVREHEELPPVEGGDELPRPAAIWGKPEPAKPETPSEPAPEEDPTVEADDAAGEEGDQESGDRSQDISDRERLRALAIDSITALQRAEIVQAERHAGTPGFAARMEEFYRSHQRKLTARLEAVGGDPTQIGDFCASHMADVLRAGRDADPAAAIALCTDGWRDDPARLADRLLRS